MAGRLGEKEGVVENWEEVLRETEKPKRSGWSANSCLRIVDLPVPDGPEITTGRGLDGEEAVLGVMGAGKRSRRCQFADKYEGWS